jgi:acetyltransferase-like isoleucine patch superfamily enzyme
MNEHSHFDPIRAIRFALWRLRGQFALRSSGAVLSEGVDAIGPPVIDLYAGSSIRFGKNVMLISRSFATALGLNHPVVLRTLTAGARIHIGNGVGISGGSICAAQLVEIGDESMLGANVTIADTDFHSLYPAHRGGHTHPTVGIAEVRIGRRVLVGTNAIVLKGVSIGNNSVVGAGSVVTKNIPENSIAAGNPCRVIRSLTPQELAEI